LTEFSEEGENKQEFFGELEAGGFDGRREMTFDRRGDLRAPIRLKGATVKKVFRESVKHFFALLT
jgi:hypothetical protein